MGRGGRREDGYQRLNFDFGPPLQRVFGMTKSPLVSSRASNVILSQKILT